MKDIVLVSGGFDPLHSGHIRLIQDASRYGEVVVLLNSDNWLNQKKGKFFLPYKERSIIMSSLKNVVNVISCGELDVTCIDGIKKAIIKYPCKKIKFANGGDRTDVTTPETIFCEQNNIEAIWGIGGSDKINSSSWILKKWNES